MGLKPGSCVWEETPDLKEPFYFDYWLLAPLFSVLLPTDKIILRTKDNYSIRLDSSLSGTCSKFHGFKDYTLWFPWIWRIP
jgi:hypothetical protein